MTQVTHYNTSTILNCASPGRVISYYYFPAYGGRASSRMVLFCFFFSFCELWVSIRFDWDALECDMTTRLAFLQKHLTWVILFFLERNYAWHSSLYCKNWWGNEVIKISKRKDLRVLISLLTSVREITPQGFFPVFLQRGLQSLLLKTPDQAMELHLLWIHTCLTSAQ